MTLGDASSSRMICSIDGEASALHRVVGQGASDGDLARLSAKREIDAKDESITSAGLVVKASGASLSSGLKRAFLTEVEDEGLPDRPLNNLGWVEEAGSKRKEIKRGRTTERAPRLSNPLSRAESRNHLDDPAIEIDLRPIEKRILSRSNTFFEDPNDPCAILEDTLLEPCPLIILPNSVSEVLSSAQSTASVFGGLIRANSWAMPERRLSSTDIHRPRALTSVINNNQLQSLSQLPALLPSQSATCVRQFGDMPTTSSTSSASSTAGYYTPQESSSKPALSVAETLPTEIVQQIFNNLPVVDFNSARHSCRSWFIYSLNNALLEIMLRRGGFSSSMMHDMMTIHASGSMAEHNETWLMSKRISRECALGPDWTGNGIKSFQPEIDAANTSPFVHVTSIDFTEVAVHYPGPDTAGTVFTISNCGRFLIAMNGCLIYIYELNRHHKSEVGTFANRPGYLLPVTSLICPRRVLACSMDTSSHRYAVAILLDGRTGLVCDITTLNRPSVSPNGAAADSTSARMPLLSKNPANEVSKSGRLQGTSFLDRVSLNSSHSPQYCARPSPHVPFVFPGIATTGALSSPVDESEWQGVLQVDRPESSGTAGSRSLPRVFVVGRDGQLQDFSMSPLGMEQSGSSMHVEDGPRSLYRNLCSDDDPPRSVAICPQRRCVAFGSSSGIELHWVDALTGQDLNRWFPLTAPSDFLFFLPPRKSIDSAKKLRLISSAARPNERPAIAERSFGSRTCNSSFWERFGWGVNHNVEGDDASSAQGILTRLRVDTGRTSVTGRMGYSDHYRAVPLSDGHHILFTDPATGLLCLGSDAPAGGPTKLLRKIWFKGPEGRGSPAMYACGSDLNWGVRAVAGFITGPDSPVLSVWLFSVPNDILAANKTTQSGSPAWSSSSSNRETQNTDWVKWWPDDGLQEWLNHVQDPVPGILPHSIWPVKIRGQMIGMCNGLVDLAVDSGPQMTIWAFSKGGIATVWKLDDGKYNGVKRLWVQRDGTVRQSEGDGDIEMSDVSPPSPATLDGPPPFSQQSFDGTSTLSTVVTTRCERRHRIEWSQQMIRYDTEGDVLMDDLRYPERSSLFERRSSEEEVAWEGIRGQMHYQREWWSRRSHRMHTRDVVEELTGIARIDVEIR